ncbi:DUF4388 domain-containing protein [Tumidithrix helvetica PCC 7403]|uniref:DUF4388 domain-containing protein n=1 Tax=Tumidithrix helvetica TaxID=3457545 RepID=UPI003C931ABA
MAIKGSLSEFSLPEIFQFLDQGQKTGLLSIRDMQDLQTGKAFARHIWFHNGRVVAAGNQLDNRGLARLIEQRGWVTDAIRPEFERLIRENAPLGLNLKALGILQPDQLKLLFGIQVIREVCALFQVETGIFRFDGKIDLPKAEMTGLSLPATETTLMGLRSLKDWKVLESKLPEPNSTLFRIIPGHPHLRLDASETQVLELANGSVKLTRMSEKFDIPIQKIQQIAFRLIVVCLVEEVPDIDANVATNSDDVIEMDDDTNGQVTSSSVQTEISTSYLQNLLGFLQQKKPW